MIEAYGTGISGFLGSKLAESTRITPIAHEAISSTELEPYSRFYFCSTYGNMAFHKEEDLVIKANVLDLIHVLQQTDFTDGVTSFVYISSSSVARKIQTMYSRTKKAAEEILLAYAEKYNAPICVVRPFSITGVGEQKEHLIPTLIRSCLKGEDMPFVPEACHDFIDVEDVAKGILTLADHHAKGIFELGTGRGHSNQEVLETVEKVTGKKAHVHLVRNMRSYDSGEWVSKNFTARQYGWEPTKSLEQTVTEMVDAYVKQT